MFGHTLDNFILNIVFFQADRGGGRKPPCSSSLDCGITYLPSLLWLAELWKRSLGSTSGNGEIFVFVPKPLIRSIHGALFARPAIHGEAFLLYEHFPVLLGSRYTAQQATAGRAGLYHNSQQAVAGRAGSAKYSIRCC